MTSSNSKLINLQKLILAEFSKSGVKVKDKLGVYIFGSGVAGRLILEALKTNYNDQSSYRIKGFIDNNPAKFGEKLHGLTIASPDMVAICHDDFILLASLSFNFEMQAQLIEMGIDKSRIIPPFGLLEPFFIDDGQEWLLPGNQQETNDLLLQKVISRVCRDESAHAREYLLHVLKRKCFLIPLDFEHTVKQPDIDYLYNQVKALIDDNIGAINRYYKEIKPFFLSDKLLKIADCKQNEIDPYWNNNFFPQGDARALYAIIAAYRPRVVVEVGAGNSSKFIRKAINDYRLETKVISIDPEPRADIQSVSDEIISKNILDMGCCTVTNMRENDIYFIDGSHLAHCGTDVVHHFLNILPQVPRGVFVHFHDIFLPYEYPAENRVRHYNEQHMLASMLLFSNQWDIVLPIYYLFMQGVISYGGASFWIRKI